MCSLRTKRLCPAKRHDANDKNVALVVASPRLCRVIRQDIGGPITGVNKSTCLLHGFQHFKRLVFKIMLLCKIFRPRIVCPIHTRGPFIRADSSIKTSAAIGQYLRGGFSKRIVTER